MLCIPKIGNYLKILTDDKVKDFVVMNFGKYFKSWQEKNIREIAESLYIFLTITDEVEICAEMM